MAFSKQLLTDIDRIADEERVPRNIFRGLVGTESNFDNGAVSPKGAVGLAQLMPATAKELGVDPSDPQQNLRGGARYLRQQYDKFGGWRKALNAYNWGPENLKKLIASGGTPADLPKQTREHEIKILGPRKQRLPAPKSSGFGLISSAEAAEAPPSDIPVGTVKTGKNGIQYEFLGGNRRDKNSWRRIDARPEEAPPTEEPKAIEEIAAPASAPKPSEPDGSFVGDAARSTIDAMTFGLADEARAAGQATGGSIARLFGLSDQPGSWSQDYNAALEAERQKNKEMGVAGQITGAAVGGLAAAPRAAAGVMARLPRWLQMGAEGVALGGAYGAGSGEGGLAERAEEAAKGAAIGGAAGVAVPAAVGVAQAARRAITPLQSAEARVAESFRRSGQTTADVQQRLAELGPEATIADAGGRNVQGLARATASLPGEGRELAEATIGTRAQAQPERVTDAISSQFGAGESWQQTFDTLDTARRSAAQPLYERAYQRVVPFTEELEGILNTDAGRKGLARARRIASNEGVDFQQFFVNSDGVRRVPDMRAWDYIKRGMDDVLESYRDGTTGRLRLDTEGRSVEGVRQRLLSELDSANPDYRAARDAWGGPTRAMGAMEQGRQFARRPSEVTQARLRDLTPGERDFFRLGVARYLWEQAGSQQGSGKIIRETLGNRNFQLALRAVSPDQGAYDAFVDDMRRLATFRDTNQNLFGGSRTAVLEREMDDLDMGAVRDIGAAIRGNPLNLAGRVADSVMNRWSAGMNERTRNEVANILFSLDPAQQRAILTELDRRMAPSNMPRMLIPGAAVGVTGATNRE